MRNEENCKPSERSLQAVMRLSDQAIRAWKTEVKNRCKEKDERYDRFIDWERQENEVAVFTMYAYADFSVPKKFDCIYPYDDPGRYIQTAFELTQSIWEGWYPINTIEDGHKHLCILAFEGPVPDMIGRLYCETGKSPGWTWDPRKVLGLCQVADIQSIIDRRDKETKLKELHGEDWDEYDDGP